MKINILLIIFFVLSSCHNTSQGASIFSQEESTIVGEYKAYYDKKPYTLMIQRISFSSNGAAFGFFGFFDHNKDKFYQALNKQNAVTFEQDKQNVCTYFRKRCSEQPDEPLCEYKEYGIIMDIHRSRPPSPLNDPSLGMLFVVLKSYPKIRIGDLYDRFSGAEYTASKFKFNENKELTITFKETGYLQLFRRKHLVFKKISNTVSENNFVQYLQDYHALSDFFVAKKGTNFCVNK